MRGGHLAIFWYESAIMIGSWFLTNSMQWLTARRAEKQIDYDAKNV